MLLVWLGAFSIPLGYQKNQKVVRGLEEGEKGGGGRERSFLRTHRHVNVLGDARLGRLTKVHLLS